MFAQYRFAAAALIGLSLASAAAARPGGWGGSGWGNTWNERDWAESRWNAPYGSFGNRDDREGKVDAASFVAPGDAAALLGKGSIAVQLDPQAKPQHDDQDQDFRLLKQDNPATDVPGAPYEAAVIDQMVKAGYDTTGKPGSETQVVELNIVRDVLVPPEAKRKPVSGEMEMGISNRGTMLGGAINLDFSKPKKALLSTRLEARIRDKASGNVLWEGHADIATRDGDDDWGDGAIAAKLAEALFKPFPGSSEKPHS